MHIGRRLAAAGMVLAAAISTTQAASADPPATPGGAVAATPAGFTSVTLVTGDRVLVSTSSSAPGQLVRPAAGRAGMAFQTYQAQGHLYVIPADAAELVATGRLDRRLFDVTTLIESRYDDASRTTLPLIVTYHGSTRTAAAAAARDLPAINGVAVNADKAGATALWNTITTEARISGAGIKKVWLDGKRRSTLDRSTAQIGAPAAWSAGLTGDGVTIAVLDSGVDQTHPDLASREIGERNFTDAPDTVDRFGHGTHVASIAAGTGATYRGVAHGANILDGKVLDNNGFGQESWIIDGMRWAAEQGAAVANLSLGGADSPELDPVEEAVNTLSAQHDTLFVIAAGNFGDRPQTIDSPGSADAALTVGAVDRADGIAGFSGRGPRIGDGAIKPDITAPGVDIVAAKAANGVIGTPVADGYVALPGTSMATPHVAGAAALLAQQHPDWTGAQIKAALTASANPNPALAAFDQGSGRVDVAKAIGQTLTTEPTNVSLGTMQWPHDDDRPVTRPLTYHNAGGTDVTLTLALDAKGPDGSPAPSGVFTLSANQITVPAGGQAQVIVSGDTKAVTVYGNYTGMIRATAGQTTFSTPVAIHHEDERYDLTLNVKDLAGGPTGRYQTTLLGVDHSMFDFPYDPDGSLTLRLPRGQYLVDTTVVTGDAQSPRYHLLPYPALTLDRNTTVDADARAAKPIKVTAPDPAARLALGDVGYDIQLASHPFARTLHLADLDTLLIGHLGPAAPAERFTSRINTQWTTPSGAFYGLAWFQAGRLPDGFTRQVTRRDVARLDAEFGAVTPNRHGERYAFPRPASGVSSATSVLSEVPLPGKRTEYYNTDGGVSWATGLLQLDDGPFPAVEAELRSAYRVFRPGHTYHDRFNHAVFGPALTRTDFTRADRLGDTMHIGVPLFSDSAGNAGLSAMTSANSKLFRNGKLFAEVPTAGGGFFDVPPERADYRLTTDVTRPEIFDVTTKLSAAWTFRSGHVDGSEPAALPLSVLRFSPRLDAANSAPAGTSFLIPVELQSQSGSVKRPRQLTVDVSYDEGRTWRRAEVLANLAVLLRHPDDATSVSLRAKAIDRDGNTVEQTIIRAYKLTRR